jgi:hypothetical protein
LIFFEITKKFGNAMALQVNEILAKYMGSMLGLLHTLKMKGVISQP